MSVLEGTQLANPTCKKTIGGNGYYLPSLAPHHQPRLSFILMYCLRLPFFLSKVIATRKDSWIVGARRDPTLPPRTNEKRGHDAKKAGALSGLAPTIVCARSCGGPKNELPNRIAAGSGTWTKKSEAANKTTPSAAYQKRTKCQVQRAVKKRSNKRNGNGSGS